MKNVKKIIFLGLILYSSFLLAQESNVVYRIKYISEENVYLDKGMSSGIEVGDQFAIIRNDKQVAKLEVVFIAQHSSSCKIIDNNIALNIGDLARRISTRKVPEKTSEKSLKRKREIPVKLNGVRKKPFVRISGGLSLQWYHYEDLNSSNLNFDQPGARLSLRARNLWGKNYTFQVKVRSRYNQRARSFSSNVPKEEWRNRIYMLSFSYDNEEALFNYKVGRIISNKFSGVGYIDGLVIQQNVSPTLSWGIFAGTQPEWQYSDFQTSLQKYGGYFNYSYGDYQTNRFETTFAFAGEYHGSTVSREFLYLQTSAGSGAKWSIYQSLELDLNRGWRKDKTGENISLTSVYMYTRYKFSGWLTAGLSYDNRKNYYTYDTRTLVESLFDDAFRHGLRGDLNFTLLKKNRIYTNFGVRKRESDVQYTYSYRGGISKMDFLVKQMSFNIYTSGFSNYYNRGISPSIRINKSFSTGHNLSFAYGIYNYSLKSDDSQRMNQWLRMNSMINLVRNVYFSGSYEYNWGDDSRGHRILTELGYRF
jgi:hypothetical protein